MLCDASPLSCQPIAAGKRSGDRANAQPCETIGGSVSWVVPSEKLHTTIGGGQRSGQARARGVRSVKAFDGLAESQQAAGRGRTGRGTMFGPSLGTVPAADGFQAAVRAPSRWRLASGSTISRLSARRFAARPAPAHCYGWRRKYWRPAPTCGNTPHVVDQAAVAEKVPARKATLAAPPRSKLVDDVPPHIPGRPGTAHSSVDRPAGGRRGQPRSVWRAETREFAAGRIPRRAQAAWPGSWMSVVTGSASRPDAARAYAKPATSMPGPRYDARSSQFPCRTRP